MALWKGAPEEEPPKERRIKIKIKRMTVAPTINALS